MRVTICDWKDGKSACEERGVALVSYTISSQRMEIDLCENHLQTINQNARPAESSSQYTKVTQIPRQTGRKVTEQIVSKDDYTDLRKWAESTGKLPEGSRGRISAAIQEEWVSEGSPRERADGTFVKSA